MKLSHLRSVLESTPELTILDENGQISDDISIAKFLKLDSETKSLDDLTDFKLQDMQLPLRVVLHCWFHRDSSAADYLADSQKKGLTNVSFLYRIDLIKLLSGESQVSQYLVEDGAAEVGEAVQQGDLVTEQDEALKQILSRERCLTDHYSSLRGTKVRNFGYLIKDAELKLVHPLKTARRSKPTSSSSHATGSRSGAASDPIIIIPSAASSIFTIANIRNFLEESQYVNPRDVPAVKSDLITVVKKFDRISKPVKFLIVNNTRLFTKPEYWNRVVAIFITGHEWQFKNYQWSNPAELFQRCKGFYFYFTGDIVPRQVDQWNVHKFELDKSKRFKDLEVLRYFWNNMEKELLTRGFH